MTQDNLFASNPPNQFQPSPFSALYPNDMTMQFAATVPHRTSPQQRPQIPINFNQSPFQTQENLIQQQCKKPPPLSHFYLYLNYMS